MSVTWVVPHQSRYLVGSANFNAQFNAPVLGAYSFATVPNSRRPLLDLEPGRAYLIERMSVGASVAEPDYLSALDWLVGGPLLTLRRLQDDMPVYSQSWPVQLYLDEAEVGVWVNVTQGADRLVAGMVGQLNQTPALVGIGEIRIFVRLSVYAIDGALYQRAYLDRQLPDLARAVRSGR